MNRSGYCLLRPRRRVTLSRLRRILGGSRANRKLAESDPSPSQWKNSRPTRKSNKQAMPPAAIGINSMNMARGLTLRIIVEQPPSGVDFALQKGTGNNYEVVQKQRSNGNDLAFEFQPSIRQSTSDSMAAIAGPFVQGPARQRFVYVDIGIYAGQADSCWSRRLKIPLEGIPAKMIRTGGVLETRVPGTGRDGGPNCATVKEFEGWKVVER